MTARFRSEELTARAALHRAHAVEQLVVDLQAKVSEREQGGRVVHRVRLGPYERRDQADKVREQLEGSGSSAVVVRVQR